MGRPLELIRANALSLPQKSVLYPVSILLVELVSGAMRALGEFPLSKSI
jgi:hypothetical protein